MRRNSFLVILIVFCIFHIYQGNAQIPDGYYNSTQNLTGEQLKSALHNTIKNHTEFPYTSSSTDVWDILKETDRDTINPDNVILFYSGWSVDAQQEYNNGSGWSREHVWAKSHGDFGTDKGAGTDAHHLRPADISVNSARNNKDFDNGGSLYIDGDGATQCRSDSDSWEPRDAVKGDVARMLFYMAVRYEGDGDEPDLELVDEVNTVSLNEPGKGYHGKLSVLQKWHEEDEVDDFERNRNEIIYGFQQNRNPFIDHPEYVELIWGSPNVASQMQFDKIVVYPNPAKDKINFNLSGDEKGVIIIYNIYGKTIVNKEIYGDYSILTDNLNNGIYLIKFVSSTGSVSYIKQIISK